MAWRPSAGPVLGIGAILTVAAACGWIVGEAPERLVLRLGPGAFSQPTRSVHVPVVQLGEEARPVIGAPESISIGEPHKARAVDGIARFPVQLPVAAVGLPDGAFVLEAQRLAIDPTEDEIQITARLLHWKRLTQWRLLRDPGDRRAVTVEVTEFDAPTTELTVRLQAIGSTPTVLLSRELEWPAGSRLELGYGLMNPPTEPVAAMPTTFGAYLECVGGIERALATNATGGREGGGHGWHDVAVPLPTGLGPCKLRLVTGGPDAEARVPVWSVPRILAPAVRARDVGPRNVVLISLDTLRADHLSSYGYARPTSPQIDARLVARGTTFTDVSTTFPLTSFAHMSLFTGLYPEANPDAHAVPAESPILMLAERLRDAGLETYAFTEDALLAGFFGFWHGFDQYTERSFAGVARGRATFEDGARFVRAHRRNRFFLFLHTYKVHHPYESSAEYHQLFSDPADGHGPGTSPDVPPDHRSRVDAYDRAIREADDQVAELLDVLDELGLSETTLVVLLSDHGEAFGEHGVLGHGFGGHQEQLRVPLVFRGPGVPAGRVEASPASIIDVTPTVLGLLGLAPLTQAQGVSLHAAFDGGVPAGPPRPLFFGWFNSATSVRLGPWKLLRTKASSQLFDLGTDPRERTPIETEAAPGFEPSELLKAHASDAERRRSAFAAAASKGESTVSGVSEELERSLRALGYL